MNLLSHKKPPEKVFHKLIKKIDPSLNQTQIKVLTLGLNSKDSKSCNKSKGNGNK